LKVDGKTVDLSEEEVKQVQETVAMLVQRRLAGVKEARPETVKGEEKVKRLKRGGKKIVKQNTTTLFDYMSLDNNH